MADVVTAAHPIRSGPATSIKPANGTIKLSLLEQISAGKKLNRVNTNTPRVSSVPSSNDAPKSIAEILAAKLAERNNRMNENSDSDSNADTYSRF
jgi:hypothetical protein